jgi:hypothetical protein
MLLRGIHVPLQEGWIIRLLNSSCSHCYSKSLMVNETSVTLLRKLLYWQLPLPLSSFVPLSDEAAPLWSGALYREWSRLLTSHQWDANICRTAILGESSFTPSE